MFRPIGRGKVLGRERGGGYVAQSESIVSSELRMAHLFIQKYMNNSLILNIIENNCVKLRIFKI